MVTSSPSSLKQASMVYYNNNLTKNLSKMSSHVSHLMNQAHGGYILTQDSRTQGQERSLILNLSVWRYNIAFTHISLAQVNLMTTCNSKDGRKVRSLGLEKVRFHSNLKERQCQRMLKLPHNCTHLTH